MNTEPGSGRISPGGAGTSVVLLMEEDRAVALETDAAGNATLLGWSRVKRRSGRGNIASPVLMAQACRRALGHDRRVDAHVGLPMSWVHHTVLSEPVPRSEQRRLAFLSAIASRAKPGSALSTEGVLFPEGAGKAGGRRRSVLITTSDARVEALILELSRHRIRVRGASCAVASVAARIAEQYEHASRSHLLILRSDGIAHAEFDESGLVALDFSPKAMPVMPKALARVVSQEFPAIAAMPPANISSAEFLRGTRRDSALEHRGGGVVVEHATIVVMGRAPKRRELFVEALKQLTNETVEIRALKNVGDWTLQAEALVADAGEGDERQLLPREITAGRGRWVAKAAVAMLAVCGAYLLGDIGVDRVDAAIERTRVETVNTRALGAAAGAMLSERAAVLERLGRFAGYRDTMAELASGRRNPADLLTIVAAALPPEARLKVLESREPLSGAAWVQVRGELRGEAAFTPVLVESFLDRIRSAFGGVAVSHAVGDAGENGLVPFVMRMALPGENVPLDGDGGRGDGEGPQRPKSRRRPRGFGPPADSALRRSGAAVGSIPEGGEPQ